MDFIVNWHVSIQIYIEVSLSLKLRAYCKEFKEFLKMFENGAKENLGSMGRLGQWS